MRKLKSFGSLIHCVTVISVLLPVLIAACSLRSTIPTRQYYIINYTPNTKFAAGSLRPYPYALHIGRFEVQRIFNRQNIIYRFSPNRVQYYEIERWAVRPDEMIKDMVFKHFEASQLTNRVSLDFLDSQPDFRIEGTVEALEKYDAGDLFYAHLAMTFKMINVKNGEQIWNYSFDRRRQVYSKEMVHTVAGLSIILQSEMDVVVGQLDSLFYSIDTGKPLVRESVSSSQKSALEDSTESGVDESAFEIIPEKKK